MGLLYFWDHSIQEIGGIVVIGCSIYGVVVIDGSLYSRFYGMCMPIHNYVVSASCLLLTLHM